MSFALAGLVNDGGKCFGDSWAPLPPSCGDFLPMPALPEDPSILGLTASLTPVRGINLK